MDEKYEAERAAMADMFESPGWSTLMRNTQDRMDAFRAQFPFNIKTVEELYMARGMMAALHELLHLQDSFAYAEQPEPENN